MQAFGVERIIALYFACLKMIVFIPTVSFHIAVVPILTLLCVVFSCSFFLFFFFFFFPIYFCWLTLFSVPLLMSTSVRAAANWFS